MGMILLLAAFSGFFYLLLPGLGAFVVRSRWRRFRSALVEASTCPRIDYGTLRSEKTGEGGRRFRFIGALEAIQDDDLLWLRNRELSLSADMTGQKVFLLPSAPTGAEGPGDTPAMESPPEEAPTEVSWDRVRSLPEGTRVFVAGSLESRDGRGVFRSRPGSELLVIFYDGDEESILRRAVWNGRQRNEYWNPFTPAALAAGTLTGMIFTYFFLKNPPSRISGILSVGAALVPVLPFLPPGIFAFLLYRRLWARARLLRAERDLVRLPLRFHGEGGGTGTLAAVRAAGAAGGEARPRAAAGTAARAPWLRAARAAARTAAREPVRDVVLPDGERYGCRVHHGRASEILARGGSIRSTSRWRPRAGEEADFFWFGIVDDREDSLPGKSSDPFVECVATPGHPEELARVCEKQARRLEALSVLLFFSGFGVNLLLALRFLARLIP